MSKSHNVRIFGLRAAPAIAVAERGKVDLIALPAPLT
jgi:hypothetical protein